MEVTALGGLAAAVLEDPVRATEVTALVDPVAEDTEDLAVVDLEDQALGDLEDQPLEDLEEQEVTK